MFNTKVHRFFEFQLQYKDASGNIQNVKVGANGLTREQVKSNLLNGFKGSFFGCELIHLG